MGGPRDGMRTNLGLLGRGSISPGLLLLPLPSPCCRRPLPDASDVDAPASSAASTTTVMLAGSPWPRCCSSSSACSSEAGSLSAPAPGRRPRNQLQKLAAGVSAWLLLLLVDCSSGASKVLSEGTAAAGKRKESRGRGCGVGGAAPGAGGGRKEQHPVPLTHLAGRAAGARRRALARSPCPLAGLGLGAGPLAEGINLDSWDGRTKQEAHGRAGGISHEEANAGEVAACAVSAARAGPRLPLQTPAPIPTLFGMT